MFLMSESQMARWRCVFKVLVILFLGVCSDAFAVKPSPPLKLSLSKSNLSNGQIELTFNVSANVTVEKIELALDLPPSVSLVSGEVKWDGTIAIGEKKDIKASIRTLSNIPAEVIGRATAYFLHGGSVDQREALLLNPPPEKVKPRLEPTIKRKQGRETILEFRGK